MNGLKQEGKSKNVEAIRVTISSSSALKVVQFHCDPYSISSCGNSTISGHQSERHLTSDM